MGEQYRAIRATWDEMFKTPYLAELLGCPALTGAQRAACETRYVVELERRFGSAEAVCAAFWASQAHGTHEETSHEASEALVTAWQAADRTARAIALNGLDVPADARFWLSFYDEVCDRPAE
jgi:hypothetical protein